MFAPKGHSALDVGLLASGPKRVIAANCRSRSESQSGLVSIGEYCGRMRRRRSRSPDPPRTAPRFGAPSRDGATHVSRNAMTSPVARRDTPVAGARVTGSILAHVHEVLDSGPHTRPRVPARRLRGGVDDDDLAGSVRALSPLEAPLEIERSVVRADDDAQRGALLTIENLSESEACKTRRGLPREPGRPHGCSLPRARLERSSSRRARPAPTGSQRGRPVA